MNRDWLTYAGIGAMLGVYVFMTILERRLRATEREEAFERRAKILRMQSNYNIFGPPSRPGPGDGGES